MQKKSLFLNSLYKGILSFANMVIPLIIGPYITKLLNIELYGAYNKVYAEFQVFLAFASFGIYTYGIREISKIRSDPRKVSQLFTNLFLMGVVTNVIVGVIYVAYATFSSTGITRQIYYVFLIQIVSNIFYMEFLNEALENYKFITIKTIIVKIIYLGLILICVRKPDDIIIYAVVISFIQFLNNMISFMYIKKTVPFSFHDIHLLRLIKPLFLVLILANIDMLYSQLDRVMLGKFVDDVSVTAYFIPYNIVSMLVSIPYSVIFVSIPRLSYVQKAEGLDAYKRILKTSVSSTLFMILPTCFGVAVLAKEIITLYAGERYLNLVNVLVLTCFVRIIISMESVLTNLVMYVSDKEKIIIRCSSLCGLSNLVLNSILVAMGYFTPFTAMFTTGVAELSLFSVQFIYAWKKLNIRAPIFNRQNIQYLLLSCCFIPIAYLVRKIDFGFYLNIPIIIVLCVTLYVSVLFVKKDPSLYVLINKFGKRLHLKRGKV